MKNLTVYLCGPITGTSYEECTDWRNYAVKFLEDKGFTVIDPMRGKYYLAKETDIKDAYEGTLHSGKHTIYKRDRFSVVKSDIIFCNLLGANSVSIGSVSEIAWGDLLHKFVVVIMEEGNIHNHAFIKEAATNTMPTLDEGLDYLVEIFCNEERE